MTAFGIQDPSGLAGSATIAGLAKGVVQFVYAVMGIVFFGMIIYAGFTWLTAEGDKDKTKQAAQILVSAVIGMIIALSAGALTGIFESVFGITFI